MSSALPIRDVCGENEKCVMPQCGQMAEASQGRETGGNNAKQV